MTPRHLNLDAVRAGSIAALQHWPADPPPPVLSALPARCRTLPWCDDHERGACLTRAAVLRAKARAPRVERIDELLAALAFQAREVDGGDPDTSALDQDAVEAYEYLETMLDCLARTGDPDVDRSSDKDPEAVEEDADA